MDDWTESGPTELKTSRMVLQVATVESSRQLKAQLVSCWHFDQLEMMWNTRDMKLALLLTNCQQVWIKVFKALVSVTIT